MGNNNIIKKQGSADVTPEAIRRIRESLGLSQVEAGELLGGGPRAFSKYENGTIKPSASVVNLLRLLEANPSALITLTGRKVVPIDSDGARPFEVTGAHIRALTDRKFANLTRRLLAAEAQSGGLPMDGIHVAAVITASDGGEDARIEWTGGPERTTFIPNRLSQFQLKATEITPAEAGADVLTSSGDIQPMIRHVLEHGGSYVMLSARPYTKKEIKKRKDRIYKTLIGADLAISDSQIQFRDADQVALWVNAHPSVATWVLEQTQPGLVGPFHDWTHWAGRYEHDSSPLVADARLVPFREKLRALITPQRGVARVVGLSGVGKSRLALEALGPTDAEETSVPRLCDLVLYAVESEVGSTVVKTIVQNLADASVRALVVVDRCDPETHQDLAAIVKRSGSRLSLVTIDHEIPSGPTLPQDTFLIKQADSVVIEAMLKRAVPGIPNEDLQRLLKFAAGNPQVAALIIRSWVNGESISTSTDEALIDRIILGRKPHDPVMLKETAMLLSVFNLVGAKPPIDKDLEQIAELSRHLTADDLRAAIDELQGRGVVQRRGRLVTLQPLRIAFDLAEGQWRQWSPQIWDKVLVGSFPEHLKIRAARQLAYLNDRPITTEIAQHVCRLSGPLASLEGLAQLGNSNVFSELSEIDTQVAAMLLERVLTPLADNELKAIRGKLRRNLVWALEKIAFASRTFEQGAMTLFNLAAAENEQIGNNATGQFKALFPVFLGNTEAGSEARLRVIDEVLKNVDVQRLNIVVDALLEGAKTDFFSRSVGAEIHGSRPALKPWQPVLWKDAWDYIRECLRRLASLAIRSDEVGTRARTGLGHNFRSLVAHGLIDFVEDLARKVIAAHGRNWPEALSSLGHVLTYDKNGLEQGVEQRVRALIEVLTPNELADRVRFLVTEMPWDFPGDENIDFDEKDKRKIAAINQLVVDLLNDPKVLVDFFPQLSVDEQRMSMPFGGSLAENATDPLILLEPIKAAVESVPREKRNFGLLAGYLAGLAVRHPKVVEMFKEETSRSEILAPALPVICWRIGITENDVALVCQALQAGLIRPSAMRQWEFGGVLAKLPPPAVAPLFDQLFNMDEGYSVALELLGMYVHGQGNRLELLRPQLRLVADFAGRRLKKYGSQMDAHHFKEMVGWILRKGRQDPDARAIAMTLAKQLAVGNKEGGDDIIKPLLPTLLSDFPEIVWPLLGQAIVADRKNAWRFEIVLGDSASFTGSKNPSILRLPEDVLFAWCHAHPDVGPAFVAGIIPVLTTQSGDSTGREIHPVVRRLLDEFGDREDVLRALTRNIYTFGWSGSLTTYYAIYEHPLRALESHPQGAVRRWASKTLVLLGREIEAAHDEDQEQDANWGI